jgi:hypothetical protein
MEPAKNAGRKVAEPFDKRQIPQGRQGSSSPRHRVPQSAFDSLRLPGVHGGLIVRVGDFVWAAAIAAVIALFAIPASATVVLDLTARYPYPLGFTKFALLATMGELLVLRLGKGTWSMPAGLWAKVLVWGIVGILVVLMFTLFNAGVMAAGAKGLLPQGEGWVGNLLVAFWTSAIMNLTFGPVFMAAHRISDAWIEARFGRKALGSGTWPQRDEVVASVDWKRFLDFVIGRTIPLFWIPAHTITFLLPAGYRIVVAAFLSIALGVILTWGKRATVMK